MKIFKRAFPNSADRYGFLILSLCAGVFFILFCIFFLPYMFIDEFANFTVIYDGHTVALNERSADSLRKADINPWSSILLEVQNDSDRSCPVTVRGTGLQEPEFTVPPKTMMAAFGARELTMITICGISYDIDFSVLR